MRADVQSCRHPFQTGLRRTPRWMRKVRELIEHHEHLSSVLRPLGLFVAKGIEIFPDALHALFTQNLDHWLIAL